MMKRIIHAYFRFALLIAMLLTPFIKGTGQTPMPDVLKSGTMKEQLNYIEEKTRIYENYRAIREDMFQKIKGNMSDTLSSDKNRISGLNKKTSNLNQTIDSLKSTLESTESNLDEMTRTKNSISVLGIAMNKLTYNAFMWTVVAVLAALLVFGFLIFKTNLAVTTNTKKELSEMKQEFEAYRKTSREAREKMSMDHFNELKKLRGG